MRFRQKVYLAAALLFFICLAGSVAFMLVTSYEMVMENEKETAISNAYLVENGMAADFSAFYKYNTLGSDNKKRIFLDYSILYRRKDIYLQLLEEGEVLHSSFRNKEYQIDWEAASDYKQLETEGRITAFLCDGKPYVAVRNEMKPPFESMALVYIAPLDKLESMVERQWLMFGLLGIFGFTFLLGSLYLMLKHLTKPLGELSQAACAMADGEYSTRISVTGKDEIAELAVNFNDMSAKIEEAIETLKEEDEKKQRFIDNLGHELRTPLTTVSGYAEYLLRASVAETEKIRILEYMIAESRRLQKLSGTLLKLAMLRTDEIEKDWIILEAMMRRVERDMQDIFQRKGIIYKGRTETDRIYGNEELLESLLVNLLENGARACGEAGHISAVWETVERHGRPCIRLTVEDDGIGIKEEELVRIEEPFYRVDRARSRKSGGIGLGVSLCREIVKCHNGTMEYESVYGEYTRIIIIFTS